jgi:hypothetical protein
LSASLLNAKDVLTFGGKSSCSNVERSKFFWL